MDHLVQDLYLSKNKVISKNTVKNQQKEYECDLCPKRFYRLNRYRAHMQMHYGTQPYKCEYPGCTKAFSEK